MKAHVMVYDGFTEFEVILANYFIKTKGEIVSVGIHEDHRIVTSFEGFQIKPHIHIDELNVDDVEILIIPGGDPDELVTCNKLRELLIELNSRQTLVAAICSGTIHLAHAKLLEYKRYTSTENVEDITTNANFIDTLAVRDGNIITAKPNGYVDFAIEIGKALDIFEDETDLNETIDFFKYFK
ncbi:thij/pfpi family protein [Bacillus sp. BGMRC 2118]|nr:thij/pfpi family protein [Bacillus sp. BGMRC 2118]